MKHIESDACRRLIPCIMSTPLSPSELHRVKTYYFSDWKLLQFSTLQVLTILSLTDCFNFAANIDRPNLNQSLLVYLLHIVSLKLSIWKLESLYCMSQMWSCDTIKIFLLTLRSAVWDCQFSGCLICYLWVCQSEPMISFFFQISLFHMGCITDLQHP